MPSNRKDSGAIGQHPTSASRNQSVDHAVLADAEELPASSTQQQTRVFPDPFLSREQAHKREHVDAPAELASPLDNLFKQLWQPIRAIILPLLFGSICCLLVLPPIATGNAHFPSEALWPLACMIIVIAILQGIAVYYSKALPGMWILCTIGGFVLLLSISLFVLFGPIPGILVVLALLALTGYLLRHSIHPVPEGVVDIVLTFGKYSRTLSTGFNLLFPWEKVTHQVNVEETHWNCPPQKIQLSRDEDVILRALISYQIIPEAAHLAVTQVKNWEESLRDTFIATLQSIATVFIPDDFLSWPQSLQTYQKQPYHPVSGSPADDFSESPERRESINDYLCQYMRARATMWGVQINWVSIRDIELAPHSLASLETLIDINQMNQQPNEQQTGQGNGPTEIQLQTVPALAGQVEPAKPIQIPKEEILIKAYKEVQDGKITDPQAIRAIAATFDAIARDSQAKESVSFDAERAAKNLYKQARTYEESSLVG